MLQLSLFEDEPVLFKITPKVREEYTKLVDSLKQNFARHAALLTVGWADPFWPDGVNLNLTRNHILYGKDKINDFHLKYGVELPEIYFRSTPERVDPEYQAPGSQSGKFYRAS